MSIGEMIRNRRIELNMTQETLAEMVGYTSKSSINKIELGKNDIPLSKVREFARALNTTESYLMGWDDTPSSSDKDAAPSGSDPMDEKLLESFHMLNDVGKRRAIGIVEDLTGNEKYTNQPSAELAI